MPVDRVRAMAPRAAFCACAFVVATITSLGVAAQTPAEFYAGRQLVLLVSAGEGGGYSTYARAFAPHLANALPGKPTVVVQNMPGGGGIRAMNFLFTAAPKDGSMIGFPQSNVPFAPIYGQKSAQFDARQAHWIGSLNATSGICVAWASSPIKTFEDMKSKEFVVGGTGAGAQNETLPIMLNKLFGTKNKVISGYKSGNEVFLAMERGEVHGRCGGLISSINSTRPDWFPQRKIVVPVQIGLTRSDRFPDIPAIGELAPDERTKRILELILSKDRMDRAMFFPPGVPLDRVSAMRKAFETAAKDPAFVADAKTQGIDVVFVSGEEVQRILERAYASPPDVVAAAVDAINPLAESSEVSGGSKQGSTK